MTAKMLAYTKKDSAIHRLTGASKLIVFLVWSVSAMVTYDTRCLLAMFVIALIALWRSKVEFREYAFVLYVILFFFLLNQLAIFAFSPQEGVKLYGARHLLFSFGGHYAVTAEQLFYQFNIALKYLTVTPMALLFILTTDPSEFAASLNRIGVPYKIAYAVSLAMRYIPDIQRDYENISFSAQARGIDISRKENLVARLKNAVSILLPLILASVERIDSVSAAMELRGFGQKARRTWYRYRPFAAGDYAAVALVIVIAVVCVSMMVVNGSRFYTIFQ
ncbi:energy-coupling factor transporter transmembrane component T family protein [Gorillibacterium massiliense]|uniref:energy-coupling factor transporter transmembrane component T family protein n=1 Tax=Gorillibacterium massiliense TaxID=1280390 RepID=UPI0004BC80B8|nr:energy-coupling factor transporter transmembrane component T [Gorillibacterium massiliense]